MGIPDFIALLRFAKNLITECGFNQMSISLKNLMIKQ